MAGSRVRLARREGSTPTHRTHVLVHVAGAGLSGATCTWLPPRIQNSALALVPAVGPRGLAAIVASSLGVKGQVPVRARRALARASSGGLNHSLAFSMSPRGGGRVWMVHVSSRRPRAWGWARQMDAATPRRAVFPLILGTHAPAAHGRDVHLPGRGQVRQASLWWPRTPHFAAPGPEVTSRVVGHGLVTGSVPTVLCLCTVPRVYRTWLCGVLWPDMRHPMFAPPFSIT